MKLDGKAPLQTALPNITSPSQDTDVVVVACHACQHLSAEVARVCIRDERDFAVMPCCHKDPHGEMKSAAAALGISLGTVMDLALIGSIQGAGHRASLRTIDESITPQNRVVIGLCGQTRDRAPRIPMSTSLEERETRMERAYIRAHKNHSEGANSETGRAAESNPGGNHIPESAAGLKEPGLQFGLRAEWPLALTMAATMGCAVWLWTSRGKRSG